VKTRSKRPAPRNGTAADAAPLAPASAPPAALAATGTLAGAPADTGPVGRITWVQAALRSDVGQNRGDNQDSVFALTTLLPSAAGDTPVPFGFFAVADGMGGLAGGAEASRTAINLVVERVLSELLLPAVRGQGGSGGQSTVAEILEAALVRAGQAIHQAARAAGAPSGTTFSGAVLLGRQLVTAHVGDSRIYLLGPDDFRLLTQDHSIVARLIAMGQFSPEDARNNPQRNVLYRSLGQAANVEVESASHSWRGYTHLLLCSDGLWDQVADAELADILRAQADIDSAADQLVRLANQRGGPDNISAIVVRLPDEAA
jgi:serine/threonine protein phosphatase PrpC